MKRYNNQHSEQGDPMKGKFFRLLDSLEKVDVDHEKYIARAKLRGWETFQYLQAGDGKRLLDVGSASGLYVPAYYDVFHYKDVAVIGLDSQPNESKEIRLADGSCYSYHSHCCDIETASWPIDADQFDTVVCTEVLEHMVFDPVFVMNEICRVLKPGGEALITIPNAGSDNCLCFLINNMQPGMLRTYFTHPLSSRKERDVRTIRGLCHFHEYTGPELRCLALACGFKIKEFRGISPLPPLINFTKLKILKFIVHVLFPRSKRVREDHLLAVLTKERYTPVDALKNRFPEPLYREGKS